MTRARTFVVDADAGVRASADDWRASKRHRGEGGETPSDGARGARGGGVVDSKTGDVIAWNVGGEFGGDVCVIKSTRGWAVRVVTPSALASSCACACGWMVISMTMDPTKRSSVGRRAR